LDGDNLMAKRAKPRVSARQLTQTDVVPQTDDEWMVYQIAGIRRQLAEMLLPLLDGPMPTRGDDGFPLNLGKRRKWYRWKTLPAKDRKRQVRRAELLKLAANATDFVESHSRPGGRITALFSAALQLGQFTERAHVVIGLGDTKHGRPTAITDDEQANARQDYVTLREDGLTQNAAAARVLKAFNVDRVDKVDKKNPGAKKKVSKSTMERVLRIRQK
jgi:hypothetical protein